MEEGKRSNVSSQPDEHIGKKARIEGNDAKLNKFLHWCQSEQLILSDKVQVGRDGSCAQYGMMAVEDIEEGEVLFCIPRTCLLQPETSAIHQLLYDEQSCIQSQSGWVPLLLALMHEYTSTSSRWRPYMDLVPDFDELDLPMFWDSETVTQELIGTGVPKAIHTDKVNIFEEFNSLVLPFVKKHAEIFPSQCRELGFYKKMVSFVMAYSFTEPVPGGADSDEEDDGMDIETKSPPMMVPMADILNHVAKNNAHLNFGKDSLKMVATEAIPRGKEVFNTYGQLANCQLLHMYGFAEPFPNNHYDTVDIPAKKLLEISCRDKDAAELQLCEKKWQFLRNTGVVHEDSMFVIGEEGVLTEDETFHTLKVLVMSDCQFAEHQEKEGWSDADDDDDSSESLTWNDIKNMPPSWKHLLKKTAEECLQLYSCSAADDEAKLNPAHFSSLTRRLQFSLHVRYGQMKLLEKLCNFCADSSQNGS